MAVFPIPMDKVTELSIETSPSYCENFSVRHKFQGVQDNDEAEEIISGFKSPIVPVIFVLGQYVQSVQWTT